MMRDHILNIAGHLFYSKGIRAVGIDEIIATAGIAKATLYRHFPAKIDLVVAYLRSRHERVLASLQSTVQKTEGSNAAAAIAQVFALLHEKAQSEEFRGCAFLLAVAEQEGSSPITDIARVHKDAVREIFRLVLVRDGRDPGPLPEQLGLLYDGALATIMIRRSPDAAMTAAEMARVLISLSAPLAKQVAIADDAAGSKRGV